MNTNHTPGPWEVDAMARDYMSQLTVMGPCPDQGRKVVANVAVDGRGNKTSFTPEQAANARLIAAAPELLEALQGLEWAVDGVAYIQEEYAEQVAKARAAIAKAIGGMNE